MGSPTVLIWGPSSSRSVGHGIDSGRRDLLIGSAVVLEDFLVGSMCEGDSLQEHYDSPNRLLVTGWACTETGSRAREVRGP